MLLKRKTYLLAIGLAAAPLCMGRYTDPRVTQFGNCASCAAASRAPLPVDMSATNFVSQINAKLATAPNSFVNGPGAGAAPNLSTLPSTLAGQNAAQAATQGLLAAQASNQAATSAAAQASALAAAQGASPAMIQQISQTAAQAASQSVLQSYTYAQGQQFNVPQFAPATQAQYNAILGTYVPVTAPTTFAPSVNSFINSYPFFSAPPMAMSPGAFW